MTVPVLIIEDDKALNQLLVSQLNDMGYTAHGARTWAQAQTYLATHEPSLVVMDVRLPDADGLALLPELANERPVIVLTAFASVKDAVSAIKGGAAEYLAKPVNLDELELLVQRVLSNAALRDEHSFLVARLRAQSKSAMLGDSPSLQRINTLIDAVAPSELTVVIEGESGVGKELVARGIHSRSLRAERNFVAIDCCALQETLFESELFGHERGAFTGADRQKKGLIEGAAGGTLFLDEIGEIAPGMQAKLLHVLEKGKFRRVGGNKYLDANVRVVAATNRDLASMSHDGEFREDLYYRLNTFSISVPPLRERRQDIPVLVEHFLVDHGFSQPIRKTVTSGAMKRLVRHNWPGNVRELRNVVERAIILSGRSAQIRDEHLLLGDEKGDGALGVTLSFRHEPTLDEIEAQYLELLLSKYSGHRATVARVLGVSDRSVYRLINRFETT